MGGQYEEICNLFLDKLREESRSEAQCYRLMEVAFAAIRKSMDCPSNVLIMTPPDEGPAEKESYSRNQIMVRTAKGIWRVGFRLVLQHPDTRFPLGRMWGEFTVVARGDEFEILSGKDKYHFASCEPPNDDLASFVSDFHDYILYYINAPMLEPEPERSSESFKISGFLAESEPLESS